MKKIIYTLLGSLCILVSYITFVWYTSDAIGRASLSTSTLLLAEPLIKDEQIITWLEKYHGEAPSHQVMINFIAWSSTHQEKAQKIIEKLSHDTIKRMVSSACDSGQTKILKQLFEVNAIESKSKKISAEINKPCHTPK